MRSPTTTTRRPAIRSDRSRSARTGTDDMALASPPRQDPLDRIEQIVGHVIGLVGPEVSAVLPLAAAVAGEHEDAGRAHRAGRSDVRHLVADHDGGAEVEIQVA